MIKTFANKQTKLISEGKTPKGVAPEVAKKAYMRLVQIDNAVQLNDLRIPFSNNLEKLSGNRKSQYSIRVNKQWRICFKFESGDFYDVEFVDYH